MAIDVERVKAENRIEDVVAETHPLRGHGQYRRGEEHDSLVVNTYKQYFFWNSQGTAGDVISWLEQTRGWDFMQALEWLARRAGLPLEVSEAEVAALKAARIKYDTLTTVAQFFQEKLRGSAAATAWATGRGWTAETLKEAGCGFWDGDTRGLAAHLRLHEIDAGSEVVQAVMKIPAGMFIYPHYVGPRVVYLSGRSIEGKRHYNLEAALVGGRQPYWNHVYHGRARHVIVVEGQADAVTLGQWGLAAVALAGTAESPELVRQLIEHEQVYVAMDADAAGRTAIGRLAPQLGPVTQIVTWPAHDANDWLQAGGTDEQCRELLGEAPTYAEWLAAAAAKAEPMDQDAARRQAMEVIAQLPELVYATKRAGLARTLSLNLSTLDKMVSAIQKSSRENGSAATKLEVTLPNGHIDGHVFEMVYDKEHEGGPRTGFAVRYPDGRTGMVSALDTDHYRIRPVPPFDSLLKAGVIRLPSALGHYDSEKTLQEEIEAFIHKYVDLPGHILKLASYYVMLTWLFDAFYVLPYLRARGDSDSGKSRFTEVVGELCMRSIFVTGSTTPSPVFRTMEKWNGLTVVMDEADLPQSETSADWVQMLNTGYKQGFSILRTAMVNGQAEVEAFNAFGPKILNMRGRFIDDATESRCLTWETASGRGIRDDIPRYMDRDEFLAEAQALRNKLLAYRLRTFATIEVDYNHELTKHLPGRLTEITVPLMSISTSPEFKAAVMEFIEAMNVKAISTRQQTLAAKVLMGILRAYYVPDEKVLELPDDHQEQLKLQVAHITRQANRIINRENAEASLEEMMDDEGGYKPLKQLSAGAVGKILNNDLNLETVRATVGTSKPMILKWDWQRINALLIRYGLNDLLEELGGEKALRDAAEAAQKLDAGEQGKLV